MSAIQTNAKLELQPSTTASAVPFSIGNLPDEMIVEIVKKLDFPTLERLEKTDEFWAKHTIEGWKSLAKQIGCPIDGDPKTQVYLFIKDLQERIGYINGYQLRHKIPTISEINLIQYILKASDTIKFWTVLSRAIGQEAPDHMLGYELDEKQRCSLVAENFTDWITEHQEQLSQLTTLDLSGWRLTSLPPEIGKLTGLQRLFLQVNGITSLPPEFAELKQLRELDLSENRFIRRPNELRELPNLETVNLDFNQIPEVVLERGFKDAITSIKNIPNRLVALAANVAAIFISTGIVCEII